jgi:hypothetical protein
MFLRRPIRIARAVTPVFVVLATALAACSVSAPTGSRSTLNLPYAVVFGHVTTGTNSTAILVSGVAYLDSASALTRQSPFGGFNPINVDAQGRYSATVISEVPRKVYFDVIALSSRTETADTDFAIPVQLDSIGGTPPHDSLELDFQFP